MDVLLQIKRLALRGELKVSAQVLTQPPMCPNRAGTDLPSSPLGKGGRASLPDPGAPARF